MKIAFQALLMDWKKVRDHDLEPDDRQHDICKPKPPGRNIDQSGIGRESADEESRHQLAGHEADHHDQRSGPDRQLEHVFHTLELLGSVIESDDRLHALTESHGGHNDQNAVAVDDSESADRQIASLADQLIVHDDIDDTRRQIHQERSHADRHDIADDSLFRDPAVAAEMYRMLRIEEMAQHEQRADEHRNDRRDGRPFDFHAEPEDKQRIEQDIQPHADQNGIHRLAGIPARAHDVAEAVAQIRQHAAGNYDPQIVLGIGNRPGRCLRKRAEYRPDTASSR